MCFLLKFVRETTVTCFTSGAAGSLKKWSRTPTSHPPTLVQVSIKVFLLRLTACISSFLITRDNHQLHKGISDLSNVECFLEIFFFA